MGRPRRKPNDAGEWWCARCAKWKPLEDFGQDVHTWSGKQSTCLGCTNLGSRTSREKSKESDPETFRRRKWGYMLWARYQMLPYDYGWQLHAQDFKCGPCGGDIYSEGEPHVEHDHVTGQVRSISHPSCNAILGLSGEDVSKLLSLIEYIKHHHAQRPEAPTE